VSVSKVSGVGRSVVDVVRAEEIRELAMTLPRTSVHVIHDRLKFRVGAIVYAALSRDETIMGFGFPKDERAALVEAEPDKFSLPSASDMRFNWVHVRLDAIDHDEMEELLTEAWRMVVPKKVAAARLGS
jgi:hypothetical protein